MAATNPRQAAYERQLGPKKPMPTPTAKKSPPGSVSGAERLLQQYLKQGMSLEKARKKVSAETGIYPNGYTN